MDELLQNAAIEGDSKFLREAVDSNRYDDEAYKSCTDSHDFHYEGNILHLAASNRKKEFLREAMKILPKPLVQFLLCQQTPRRKYNPLHLAALNGDSISVRVMLDYFNKCCSFSDDDDRPWLMNDSKGHTPLRFVMENCNEECALKVLSLDSHHLIRPMVPQTLPLHFALRRGFSRVVSKFFTSTLSGDNFHKRRLIQALEEAPNCSDEVFRLVLEKNVELIEDKRLYNRTGILRSWASIGKLYPFEYVLMGETTPANFRRILIEDGMRNDDFPHYNSLHLAAKHGDEASSLKISQIMVDAYKKEKEEEIISEDFRAPWFAFNGEGKTPLHEAISRRHENLALYYLSLDMVELSLEKDRNYLFLAIENKCLRVAEKILELVSKHKLLELLTSDTGRTVLHDAPKCTESFLRLLLDFFWVQRRLLSNRLVLIDQHDEAGVNFLHSWVKSNELWPFEVFMPYNAYDTILMYYPVNKCDVQERNPLHYAVEFGIEGVVEKIVPFFTHTNSRISLLRALRTKDIEGYTPLMKAMSLKREELGLCFLSDREMIDVADKDIIFKATEYKCDRVVKHLLDWVHQHRDSKSILQSNGQNFLHIGSKSTEENCRFMVENFPEFINEVDMDGKTPLDKASEDSAPWLVKLILQKDRSSIEKAPKAWVQACEKRHLSTVLTFIDESPYFRYICAEQHDTPLHHVQGLTYMDYQELLKRPLMREWKNLQNSDRKTPLHLAIENRDIEFAEVLLTMKDVRRNIKDKYHRTAMGLLKEACEEHREWKEMCERIHVDPNSKTSYIQPNTDLTEMRNMISIVAALLATITFTAGFTLPGGLNSDNGHAILAKKASFLVFLIANTYAMCASIIILFCVIWSMVSEDSESVVLIDRSLVLLQHSLYGTLLTFMTGVYTAVHHKSLWATIIIIVMCSLVVVSASKTFLYKLISVLPGAGDEHVILRLFHWCVKREKEELTPPNNQTQVQEGTSHNYRKETEDYP